MLRRTTQHHYFTSRFSISHLSTTTTNLVLYWLLSSTSSAYPAASFAAFGYPTSATSTGSTPSHQSTTRTFATSLIPEHTAVAMDGSEYVRLDQSQWYQESKLRQDALQKCIPPLTSKGHKGSSGRVGIVGGSARYTGAPYYASMASLKVGADLAFVFCAEEATLPIKSYSPELMVASIYKASEFDHFVKKIGNVLKHDPNAEASIQDMVKQVEEMFDKLHALVIGPGLGRCPMVMEAASRIIRKAQDQNIPLVLDADALYILTLPEYQDLLSPKNGDDDKDDTCKDENNGSGGDGDRRRRRQSVVVLTPNVMERKRLKGKEENWDKNRIVVVQKGSEDMIESSFGADDDDDDNYNNMDTTLKCAEIGGLKRSGGMGDVLAGTLGTMMAWNSILASQNDDDDDDDDHEKTTASNVSNADVPLACWTACSLVRRSTHEAYHKHHRAMTAPDVLDAVGPTFHDMTTKIE